MPTHERQVRPLAGLDPETQQKAWKIATEQKPNPTAAEVQAAVESLEGDNNNDSKSGQQHHPVFDINITGEQIKLSPEEEECSELRQELQKAMDEFKTTVTNWFDQFPSLETRREGVQRLKERLDAFRERLTDLGGWCG